MSWSGADASALRWFAGRARRVRHEVDGVRDEVALIIERLPWRGADRDRFVDEWRQVHATSITAAAADLGAAARLAERAAEQQELAAGARP